MGFGKNNKLKKWDMGCVRDGNHDSNVANLSKYHVWREFLAIIAAASSSTVTFCTQFLPINNFLWPQLKEVDLENIWCQQDRATCHIYYLWGNLKSLVFSNKPWSLQGPFRSQYCYLWYTIWNKYWEIGFNKFLQKKSLRSFESCYI